MQEPGIKDVRQNGKEVSRRNNKLDNKMGIQERRKCKAVGSKELAVMNDEIKNLKMGSGSTVCSEASARVGLGSGTFARPPPLTSRWNEIFVPRRMEFKGWVTDYAKR